MISLGENIKKYRQLKGMTQTQLASVFNMSEQAISRWETGTTYPDIVLLPALADFFGITIDELMGMEHYNDEAEIDSIIKTVKDNQRQGKISNNVDILQDALKKYPKNYIIMNYLIDQLLFENCGGDAEKEKLNGEKAIELSNRLLNECTDREICNYVVNLKINALQRLGRMEEAIDLAQSQPSIWESRDFRLNTLYEGEEQKTHSKNTVMQFAQALYWTILQLTDLGFEDASLTIRDRINIGKKSLEMLDVIYEGNYGTESRLVWQMNRYIAAMEVLEGNIEETLYHLELAAKYAVISDTLPKSISLTSTLLNGYILDTTNCFKNFSESECSMLRHSLNGERYNIVRETERFKAIENQIAEYV